VRYDCSVLLSLIRTFCDGCACNGLIVRAVVRQTKKHIWKIEVHVGSLVLYESYFEKSSAGITLM